MSSQHQKELPPQQQGKAQLRIRQSIRQSSLTSIEEGSTEPNLNSSNNSNFEIATTPRTSPSESSATNSNGSNKFVKSRNPLVNQSAIAGSLIQSTKEFSVDFPLGNSGSSMQSAKEFAIDFPIGNSTNNKRDSLAKINSDSSFDFVHSSLYSPNSSAHSRDLGNSPKHSPNNSATSFDMSGSLLEGSLNLDDISERDDEDMSEELQAGNTRRSLSFTQPGSSGELRASKELSESSRRSLSFVQPGSKGSLLGSNGSLLGSKSSGLHGSKNSRQSTFSSNSSLLSSTSSRRYNSNNSRESLMDSSTLKSIRHRRLGRPSAMHNHSATRPNGNRRSTVTFETDSSRALHGQHFDSIGEDIETSEQFFVDPKRTSVLSHHHSEDQKHVNFRHIRQGQQSMMQELDEVEKYLATLRQSVYDTRKSVEFSSSSTGTSLITAETDERSARPGIPKAATSPGSAPKSRRRFSMAYRTTDEVVTFPDDCFSFLILHDPIGSPLFFWFAFMISVLQLGFLVLALLSMVHPEWTATGKTENPYDYFFYFPPSVTGVMRFTQLLAVTSYCLFADMSVKDYLTAIELFPQYSKLEKGDKYWCMVFSCFLRFTMGILTVIVTLIMLLTNTSVIDTILDFLAMNFISDIGKMAFQLCLWGKYGWKLEEEARRIEDMQLPKCMIRKTSQRRYIISVAPILLFALSLIIWLFANQQSNNHWTTQTLKLQFDDNSPLESYSGCYERNTTFRTGWFNNRVNYDRYDDNIIDMKDTTMGFCKDHWFLFSSEEKSPCKVLDEDKILRSSTSSFLYDINGYIGLPWSDGYGNPVQVSLSTDSDVDKDLCGIFRHDGHCDVDLNDVANNYDGGDCCASTCIGIECGFGALDHTTFFGTHVHSGDGFPNCTDPSLVNITIKIEDVFNSTEYDMELMTLTATTNGTDELFIPEYASDDIIEPKMVLDCDNKNIFTVHIKQDMSGHMETFMVEDGASCTLRITNSTSSTQSMQQAMWYVNYTVYHGNTTDVENEPIIIHQDQSVDNEFAMFQRLPDCYFEKLSDYTDNTTIYGTTEPEQKAIRWLLYNSLFSSNSACEDNFFLERYALSVINFAALPERWNHVGQTTDEIISHFLYLTRAEQETYLKELAEEYFWLEDTRQCIWPAVDCRQRSVEGLDLHGMTLEGTIPSAIGILTSLTKIDFGKHH